MKKIAIIGGGANGISTLYQLVDVLSKKSRANTTIYFIEKANLGGLAYNTKQNCNLLNLSCDMMSITASCKTHFSMWCNANEYTDKDAFIPRGKFAYYLKACFEESLNKAKANDIEVITLKATAYDLYSLSHDYLIKTTVKDVLASHVILTTGHFPTESIAALAGNDNYIKSPWCYQSMMKIPSSEKVAVIGTRLTAIDTVKMLHANNHRGPIHMISRSGRLPCVQTCKQTPYKLNIISKDKLKKKRNSLTLSQVFSLLQRELNHANGCDIDFCALTDVKSPMDFLTQELMLSKKPRPWQACLNSLYETGQIDMLWQCLDRHSQLLFKMRYQSLWMAYKHAMPAVNAQLLIELLQQGQLTITSIGSIGIKDGGIRYYDKTGNKWVYVDTVIDGRGCGQANAQEGSLLLTNLIGNNLLVKNAHGGFEVCVNSYQALQDNGKLLSNVFLVGALTSGLFISSNALSHGVRQISTIVNLIA
jgi:uncharacterized NAD(P)/FAD-binding protein YdhS